jgi:hypothetical protein
MGRPHEEASVDERPHAVLRLEPHRIPALRSAFDEAAASIRDELARLGHEGLLPGPWLGDPVSAAVAAAYHEQIMNGPGSAYAHLTAYHGELVAAVRALEEMEAAYRRTEGANAALWGHRA